MQQYTIKEGVIEFQRTLDIYTQPQVTETSKDAYSKIRDFREPSQADQLYFILLDEEGEGYTLKELEAITGLYPSTISARLNFLAEKGKAEVFKTRECTITGNTVNAWRVCLKRK